MANARDIKKRIKAVGNIRRITKTMQMIATSRYARAQQAAVATKPYTEGVFELVTELAAKAGNVSHPLIDGPAGGPKGNEVVLVLASNRGLCGPYNGNVLRAALAYAREAGLYGPKKSRDGILEVSGKKAVAFFRFAGAKIDTVHSQFGDKPRYEDVEQLAESYMDRFVTGQISAVRVAYMRYISASRQKPEVMQLLPLKPPAKATDAGPKGPAVEYEFSPPPAELLKDLLPQTVKASLFQAFTDSVVSEHVSRMIAMKAATDNAGKMGKALQRKYNRARQSQITTELTEIISGAAALE